MISKKLTFKICIKNVHEKLLGLMILKDLNLKCFLYIKKRANLVLVLLQYIL